MLQEVALQGSTATHNYMLVACTNKCCNCATYIIAIHHRLYVLQAVREESYWFFQII